MSLAILFHFLCTQHISDINISIIRGLRLCYWILFHFLCTQHVSDINISIIRSLRLCYWILFHFLCTQHVSDINISIIRGLRLCYWITTSVALFSVRCVLEIWCDWVWVVSVLQASACNTDTTPTQPHQRIRANYIVLAADIKKLDVSGNAL